MRKMTTLAIGIAISALLAASCSSADPDDTAATNTTESSSESATAPAPTSPTSPGEPGEPGQPGEPGEPTESSGIFSTSGPGFTYDEAAVPVGSNVAVQVSVKDGATTVELTVDGLEPNRDFGAHAHANACGPMPADSGPHYQDEQDPAATPESPSDDPAYANTQNELWLDFTTDDSGAANASTTVDWEFRAEGAKSVVIHDHQTSTEPGEAGTAGDRLACAPVQF